ncbi:hypothetical protein LTR08_002895 [Meristemomyces frigidus]|nr:hypothetical protein LTR08_002895 [Meristemomyces frigidus]
MAATRARETTVMDKLTMIPGTGLTLSSAVYRLVTAPFTSGPRANTVFKDAIFAALRTHLSNVTPGQEKWLNTTTESSYSHLAKQEKFQPDTDVLPSGMKAHWLGSKSAKKTILFFHGGGYVLGATAGHFKWLHDLQMDLSKDCSVNIVLPGYTLAPEAQYPVQMKQGVECLKWLLDDLGKKPSDVRAHHIIVAGDSAGGNLTVAVLSHILHPYRSTPKIELLEPLAGALLISPWVEMTANEDSGKPLDEYNDPIQADSNWFSSLETQVDDIFVWGGSGEVLFDSIEAFTKKLKQVHPRVQYVVQPGASHEDFIMDRTLGYTNKAEGTKKVESWLSQRL